mmetsp:Transcript_133204/g.385435  ORF Transcript_133204/g.385435 Transcript_133204/m.385435 type:complete len:220 (-) Transcript_133204:333-992(-)
MSGATPRNNSHGLGDVALHRFEKVEAAVPDGLDRCIFVFFRCLVAETDAVDNPLELHFEFLDFALPLLDLLLPLLGPQASEKLDLSLLFDAADVHVGRAAHGPQLRSKIREVLVGAATSVVRQTAGIAVLDGRKPSNANLVAHGFSSAHAIHVGDDNRGMVLILLLQAHPCRLHPLAMPAPRGVKHHEGRLSCGGLLPSLLCQSWPTPEAQVVPRQRSI